MSRPWTAVYEAVRTSRKLARLPDDTCRLFYLQLLLVVDSYGCIEADPVGLDAKVWPALKKPEEETARVVNELWRVGLVDIHGNSEVYWLHLPDWDEKAGSHFRKRGKPEYPIGPGTLQTGDIALSGTVPVRTGTVLVRPGTDLVGSGTEKNGRKKERKTERDQEGERKNEKHVRSAHPVPKPKPDPEKIPNYREAIDLWCKLYESVCGRPYGFDGGKDGKHMKAILTFAKSDLSVIRERTLMLLHAAPEWIDKGGKDLGTLRSAWNKLSSMGTGQTSGSKQIALQGILGPLEGKPPEITHPAPSGLLDLPRTKGNR